MATPQGLLLVLLALVALAVFATAPRHERAVAGFLHRSSSTLAPLSGASASRAAETPQTLSRRPRAAATAGGADAVLAAVAAAAAAVRGAAPGVVQKRYADQREAGHFKCFDGSKSFRSFDDVVNDDFCDCADGSDEPGTSACAGVARPALVGFSCRWAAASLSEDTADARNRVVRFAVVNDGICDCCGSEDEWDGLVTCPDRCSAEEAAAEAAASEALVGSRAREALVHKAAKLAGYKRYQAYDGGPDGVYLAVAAEGCLTKLDGEYTYKLCFFDRVSQIGSSGNSFTLGRGGDWSTSLWEDGRQRKDWSKLIMDNGDFCAPASAPRKAELLLECAAAPALVAVRETQVCVYTFRVQTPAACPPLGHHSGHS